ncbi:c-type cytochrome [Desertibaculum subflavum]|uniref:c-type cytochrome n=1 Tax=Desertibaculum subflavum TaxID=2268458 RepID=UPI000E662C0B
MQRFTKIIAAAAGLAVVGAFGMALAQGDPIANRKANFKMMADAMKATKAVIDAGGPTAKAVPEAEKIVQVARVNPGHFPTGSDKGDTKALPEIWTNKADFEKKFANLEAEGAKLVMAAQGGDAKALGAQFGKVGGACKACHDVYRGK